MAHNNSSNGVCATETIEGLINPRIRTCSKDGEATNMANHFLDPTKKKDQTRIQLDCP